MADSTGVNAVAGSPLSDWDHVRQSVAKILTTPLGRRVMRRDFGSNIPDLIDAKMIQRNILALYVAAAAAIDKWEPRFRVTQARIEELSATGLVRLDLVGVYFPRGHVGDFSLAQDATTRVIFGD